MASIRGLRAPRSSSSTIVSDKRSAHATSYKSFSFSSSQFVGDKIALPPSSVQRRRQHCAGVRRTSLIVKGVSDSRNSQTCLDLDTSGGKDLKRLILSAFYHLDESHLVYNMMSLLWKGIQLETLMGSFEFASMISALLIMSQGITLILAKSLLLFFGYKRAYYEEYSVGFSGVLFGMKVVLNSQSNNNYNNIYGVMVPSKYAAWAELFLIQLLVPGVSFLGHLSGILAGIIYLRLKASSYSGPGDPLTRSIRDFLSWPLRFFRFQRQRVFGRGLVGGRQTTISPTTPSSWRCEVCTFDNSGWLSLCEMCETARNDDGLSSHELPPMEELRRWRVERFER